MQKHKCLLVIKIGARIIKSLFFTTEKHIEHSLQTIALTCSPIASSNVPVPHPRFVTEPLSNERNQN